MSATNGKPGVSSIRSGGQNALQKDIFSRLAVLYLQDSPGNELSEVFFSSNGTHEPSYTPSQRGTALSHTTLPSLRMQEMVREPWVLTKPSSHRNEMELPSWRLSPKRFPLTGTPGSGHSLWRNAYGSAEKRWGLVRSTESAFRRLEKKPHHYYRLLNTLAINRKNAFPCA